MDFAGPTKDGFRRADYVDRSRLPRGFRDGFRLEFDAVNPGSAAVPIRRVRSDAQDAPFDDEFAEAAELIDATIEAAARDDLLPAQLPPNVIPLFGKRGLKALLRQADA